jgi:hypothetical protein
MKKLVFLALCLLSINIITAQTSINAAGGSIENAGVSFSYSIGQVFYETNILNEGVQLPYNIIGVVGIEDIDSIFLNIAAYPNPTSDFLELKIETKDLDFKNVRYQIFDINGNHLKSDKIDGFQTIISMENALLGVYILEVKLKNKTVKTFKIVKN